MVRKRHCHHLVYSPLVPTRPTTESPCIKVCHLDVHDVCTGCRRTLDEIVRWSTMSQPERIAVNQRVGFESHEARC